MGSESEKQVVMTESEVRMLVRQTVNEVLVSLGVEHETPLEMQKDFSHLRDMRNAKESMAKKTQLTLLGIFIVAVISTFMVGLKEYFKS